MSVTLARRIARRQLAGDGFKLLVAALVYGTFLNFAQPLSLTAAILCCAAGLTGLAVGNKATATIGDLVGAALGWSFLVGISQAAAELWSRGDFPWSSALIWGAYGFGVFNVFLVVILNRLPALNRPYTY